MALRRSALRKATHHCLPRTIRAVKVGEYFFAKKELRKNLPPSLDRAAM